MDEKEMEGILAWAAVAGGYSLTRIYLRVRKLHGISRLDPEYRRCRPYLLSKQLAGTWLCGKQVLGDRRTAVQFLNLLQSRLGSPQLKDATAKSELPRHGRQELGIIFLELHEQTYGTREWTPATVADTLRVMERHLEGSWLPGDWVEVDISPQQADNYNKNVKFRQWCWTREVIEFLYGEGEEADASVCPVEPPEAPGGTGDHQGLGSSDFILGNFAEPKGLPA